MSAFNKFNSFAEAVCEKKHNLGADSIKWILTNIAPVATNTVKANLTEIAAGNGYAAGGVVQAITSSSETSGTYTLVMDGDKVITASGGTIGPIKYAVAYNDTAANKELIGWYVYPTAAFTVADGENFTIKSDGLTLISLG
jgi:hypothetical protein